MLEVTGLSRSFDGTPVVKGVSFQIQPGEIVGYLGPNGAGKSTTVRMLTGMLRADSGSVKVGGHCLSESPLEVKRRLGYVPESAELYPTLTANEYLSLVAELRHVDPEQARTRIHDLLDAFGVLSAANRQISELSKGMRQKVLLTSALLHTPSVLLLDEPLNGLDVNAVLTFRRILEGLARRGTAILYCSHILDVVERLCGRVIVLREGEIIADSPTAELVKRTSQGTLESVFRELTHQPGDDEEVTAFLAALDESPGPRPAAGSSTDDAHNAAEQSREHGTGDRR